MAYYIKVNRLVAEHLKLTGHRTQTKDGNFLLWQADMSAFGPLPQILDSCRKIGGVALMPHEAKQEQLGTMQRELPVAEDERFVLPQEEAGESEEEVSNETIESDEYSERNQNN